VLVLLSPAKKLDFSSQLPALPRATRPRFGNESSALIERLAPLGARRLAELMGLSASLADLNHERFLALAGSGDAPPPTRPAVLAFAGDTYVGLRARELGIEALEFAQRHLRILSGLYGVLRPLDLIAPHRLEMGTRLHTERGDSLYAFWGELIAVQLRKDLRAAQTKVVLNCASQEYFAAVDSAALGAPVITAVFREKKGDTSKVVGLFAKQARGSLARYVIEQRLTDIEGIKRFTEGGYRFVRAESSETDWVFTRGR
jgi:hypothetical protein